MDKLALAISKLFPIDVNNYVFIYCPPKVGSTSLVSSLRISLNQYNIIHIHDEIMLKVLTGIENISINEIIKKLSKNGKKVYVIDIYRSPIERKMSEYFEKLEAYHFNNSEEKIKNYEIDRITKRFNNLFVHLGNGDHYMDKYEITDVLSFDFKKKHIIQEVNNITYIKLRLCDSNEWSKMLTPVFNKQIVIIKDYETEKKEIGGLYKKFKEEYRIPKNHLETVEKDVNLNRYYSTSEKQKYIDDWKMKTSDSVAGYNSLEYNLYVSIYLENQYISDIQKEHYIDTGCICKVCSEKRDILYEKLKSGMAMTTEKIKHVERIKHIERRKHIERIKCIERIKHVERNNNMEKRAWKKSLNFL